MKLTPINAQRARDGIDKQREDGLPADWDADISFRGVSRNTASGHYVVKLAVSGTQFFLGTAYSQPTAALIYDYAVWKFAGKMSRAAHVNFPDDFARITQADIDRDCPRLNELYLKIPFNLVGDSELPEAELRATRIQHEKFVASPTNVKDYYLTVLGRLKRLRLQSTENFEHVTDWHSRLGFGLNKVPDVFNRLDAVAKHYATISKELQELEASMEANHSYYQKVTHEKI